MPKAGGCPARLRTLPWTQVTLGDEPLHTVLMLALVAFLLPPEAESWLALFALLAVAVPLRIWLLCRHVLPRART
jgi:hypothetical protein